MTLFSHQEQEPSVTPSVCRELGVVPSDYQHLSKTVVLKLTSMIFENGGTLVKGLYTSGLSHQRVLCLRQRQASAKFSQSEQQYQGLTTLIRPVFVSSKSPLKLLDASGGHQHVMESCSVECTTMHA